MSLTSSRNLTAKKQMFQSKISNYLTNSVGKIMLYSPPGGGKTFLLRGLLTDGLLGIDSDDLYIYWESKLQKNTRADKLDTSQIMAAWSLFGSTAVFDVRVGVTNLHKWYLLYSSRIGFANIAYLPEKELYLSRLSGRKDNTIATFSKWYEDAEKMINQWKTLSEMRKGFDVVINTIDEFRYLVYSNHFNTMGDSFKINRDYGSEYHDANYGKALRAAIMRQYDKSKTYVVLGIGPSELKQLAFGTVKTLIYGKRNDDMLSIPYKETNPSTGPFLELGLDKFETIYHILNFVGADVDNCIELVNEFTTVQHFEFKYNQKTNFYSASMYRSVFDYNLPEVTTYSHDYMKLIISELDLFRKTVKDSKCRRLVYFMIVRNVFTTPLIKNLKGKILYLPFQNYDSTRVAIFYDKNLANDDLELSLSEVYSNVLTFNEMRKNFPKYEEIAFNTIMSSLTHNIDILNYRPNKNHFVVGLFSLSNLSNHPLTVRRFIRRVVRRCKCIFTLPNSKMEKYISSDENMFKDGKLITKHEGVEYIDHGYNPNEFWEMKGVAIYPTLDIIWRGRYSEVRDCDFKVYRLPPHDGSSLMHKVWFAVGKLDDETRIQTHQNSQTHSMLPIAKLLRTVFGFDSNRVYRLRSLISKGRDEDVTAVLSSRGTYVQDEKVYSTPGHAINLIIASNFMIIDMERWFDTIEGNYLYHLDVNFKKRVDIEAAHGNISEIDSVDKMWHPPGDFIDLVDTTRVLCNILDMDFQDRYITKRVKKLIEEYGNRLLQPSDEKLVLS